MGNGRDNKRKLTAETATEANSGEPKHDGYWDTKPSDNPAGYGGGRSAGEEFSRRSFGNAGWSASRKSEAISLSASRRLSMALTITDHLKVRLRPPRFPRRDKDYVVENADKYGQAGGKPTEAARTIAERRWLRTKSAGPGRN